LLNREWLGAMKARNLLSIIDAIAWLAVALVAVQILWNPLLAAYLAVTGADTLPAFPAPIFLAAVLSGPAAGWLVHRRNVKRRFDIETADAMSGESLMSEGPNATNMPGWLLRPFPGIDTLAWIFFIGFCATMIWGLLGPAKVPPGTPLPLPVKLLAVGLLPATASIIWVLVRRSARYQSEKVRLKAAGAGQLPDWRILGAPLGAGAIGLFLILVVALSKSG
jgi:hypothetical protein